MTMQEVKDLKINEMKKLETLEKIVALLEKLEEDVDSEAVEWVMEKINE